MDIAFVAAEGMGFGLKLSFICNLTGTRWEDMRLELNLNQTV
jgi:hypothetical protein